LFRRATREIVRDLTEAAKMSGQSQREILTPRRRASPPDSFDLHIALIKIIAPGIGGPITQLAQKSGANIGFPPN
jgi:hypothetical protein